MRELWDQPVEFANALVVSTTEAAWGLLAPTVSQFAIVPRYRAVELHFVIPEPDGSEQEDIDDIVDALNNLTNDDVDISVVVQIERLDWRNMQFRGIYSVRTKRQSGSK